MKTALKVGISLGILAGLILLLPWEELWGAATRITPAVWLGIFCWYVTGHGLSAVKWRRILSVGRAELSGLDAVRCYAAGLFANLWLPTIIGGDVWRAALAGKATGRTEAAAVGGIGDRLSDMVALVLLSFVGALFARSALPAWARDVIGVLMVAGVLGIATLAVLVTRWPASRWPRRFRRSIGRTLVAGRRLMRARSAAAFVFALSLIIQAGFVLFTAWIGHSVGIEVPLSAWFVAWPLAKVASMLPISVGGLGVRETALGAALASFGSSMAAGVVVSLVWVSVSLVGGLTAGAIALLLGVRLRAPSSPPGPRMPQPVTHRNG